MNMTIRAAGKAAKRSLTLWLIGGAVVIVGLAINTDCFTRQPRWSPWDHTFITRE